MLPAFVISLALIAFFLIGWLVMFHGISTFVGYLLPKPVYTYI